MKTVAAVCAGGRFVTPATFAVIAIVSVLVLAPTSVTMTFAHKSTIAALTAAVFGAAWALVGVAERRIPHPPTRLALVLAMLVTASVLRPGLQDAVSIALGSPPAPAGAEVLRAVTNLVVWTLTLVGTAVLTDSARRTRETDALLRAVLAQLDASADRAHTFSIAARSTALSAAEALRSPLIAAPGAVRERAITVRAAAHDLAARADGIPRDDLPPVDVAGSRVRVTLRLPPWGLLSAVYALAVLPYAARTLDAGEVAAGLALTAAVGLLAESAPRWPRRRRAHLAVFFCAVIPAGLALCVIAAVQQVPWPAAAIPAVAFPTLALALAAWRGATHALEVERRRLSAAIARRTRTDDLGTRATRTGLRAAADALHRDAQSALVHFTVRHPDPSSTEIAGLSSTLATIADAVVDAFDSPSTTAGSLAVDEVLRTWGRAMPVTWRITDDARAALDADPALATDALEIVAEALLNVAKHAARPHAVVLAEVVASGDGPLLRILVRSPGVPTRGAVLRPGAPAARRGARLVAEPTGTLLTADLPLAAAPFVVSTEHPLGATGEPA